MSINTFAPRLPYESNEQLYAGSPEGPLMTVDRAGGLPKLGVPSEFQLTFCAMVYLLASQLPFELRVAW